MHTTKTIPMFLLKKLPHVLKKNYLEFLLRKTPTKKNRALLHVQSACNEASIYIYILLTAVVVTGFQQVQGLKLVLVTRFVGK